MLQPRGGVRVRILDDESSEGQWRSCGYTVRLRGQWLGMERGVAVKRGVTRTSSMLSMSLTRNAQKRMKS